jgi:hypothetical protein
VQPQVTIPFPPDLFEALAQRVAELLAEQPPVQRYMDSETAAAYLGIELKTLKTKSWRDEHDVPYGYIGGRLLFDRLALDERFASCNGAPEGSYIVSRVATALSTGGRQ